jgi:uncharacterized membrane-anchored protein
MILPPNHPQREELNNEVHARPPENLFAPTRVSYLALFAEGGAREQGWRQAQNLAERFGVAPPDARANHFSADLGPFRVKCERHTEFLRFKFIIAGATDHPFDDPAIRAVPADWLAELPGQLIVAANVGLLRADGRDPDFDRISEQFFDGAPLVGSSVGEHAALAVTDFRIRGDGFSRFLVLDRTMTPRQAGRMVQRLLEIDTYRILALMALPVARGLAPLLSKGEDELAEITRSLVEAQEADEAVLLERLTRLEASIESEQSRNQYRFSAAAAYEALVHRRIEELQEQRLPALQTFQEFTQRRLAPAMDTCRSVAARQESLSQHLTRVTQLLATRVDITREGQSQRVLESMNRRAHLQLRLQETVEGLSVAAISYYIVGLVGYAAKGAKAAGLSIDVEVVTAISIPIIVVLIGFGLRRIRHILTRDV